ncbi:SDR family NAD(P)-dependent oxidoreductase [Kribbella sp. NPDC051587]|uniref:SDR family NAD(P)-dependent oxidoreductase n=1 Tax=Kribbella sp. NPDC051587 TaxID=3364119 RepID=UPI003789DA3E
MSEAVRDAVGTLSGRTIMITGASSGIGAAAARWFAVEGAAVVLMARRKDKLEEIAAEIRAAGGRVELAPGDVTDTDAVERAVATAVRAFGGLNGAFNNAGWGTIGTLLHETDDADFERTMDVNVRGTWNCLKHQLPVMIEAGGGSVVNTSSTAGEFATGAGSAYVAAKHAVLGLTRAAAAEYGQFGIRINALIVGTTRTELIENAIRAFPPLEQGSVARQIQPRMADPIEVARAAAWLLSDQASFITGGAIPVDGGASAI